MVVANASGINGAAGRMTDALGRRRLHHRGSATNSSEGQLETTKIYYDPANENAQAGGRFAPRSARRRRHRSARADRSRRRPTPARSVTRSCSSRWATTPPTSRSTSCRVGAAGTADAPPTRDRATTASSEESSSSEPSADDVDDRGLVRVDEERRPTAGSSGRFVRQFANAGQQHLERRSVQAALGHDHVRVALAGLDEQLRGSAAPSRGTDRGCSPASCLVRRRRGGGAG